ncbi:MAG: neutral zinc metallopeptidase [Acidimicrobiaceae bacterium]|nr:neutral zinc metallopeptidase [Acidimicrobiaceae bacterium]
MSAPRDLASSRRRTLVGGLVAAAMVLAACGSSDQGVSARRSDGAIQDPDVTVPDQTSPDQTIPDQPDPQDPTVSTNPDSPLEPPEDTTPPPVGEPIIDFGDNHPGQPYDNFLNASFQDLTDWWTEVYPTLYGGAFEPVAGIYAHYPDRTPLPDSCDGPVPYELVEYNAFYTWCGDIIVYDDAQLLPELVSNLGAAAVGVVAAHEYGHAIQQRAGVFDLNLPTVDTEQQADCFAGAWAAHVALGESDLLTFGDQDVKSGIIAMIEVRDPVGTDVLDPSGHGTAFDRVGAFQEGFLKGAQRCADFIQNPNPRIDLTFTAEDFETGGNLPYADILELLPAALDIFWEPTLTNAGVAFTPPTLQPFQPGAEPACDSFAASDLTNDATFCTSTNTIVFDEVFVQDLYARLGDLSFGYPLASAYSDAVQVALQSSLSGEPRVLLNDCLVGAWIIDIVPSGQVSDTGFPIPNNPNQEIVLSAGDLDEAVITAVALGDEATSDNVNGTAFEKIDSFRAGVLGGLPACQNRIG